MATIQAFCYLRTQYPRESSDYVEEIKYKEGLRPPDEVILKLREIHKAFARELLVSECVLCFPIEVDGDRFVCVCRANVIKPGGGRNYQTLKALFVEASDLERNMADPFAIGSVRDWEMIGQKKEPILKVELTTLEQSISTEAVRQYLHVVRESKQRVVEWAPEIKNLDAMINTVRSMFTYLPSDQKQTWCIAIGVPKNLVLPLKIDLLIEPREVISVPTVVQTVPQSNTAASSDAIRSFLKLEEAIMSSRKLAEQPPRWNHLAMQVEEIHTDLEMLLARTHDSPSKRQLKPLLQRLDRVRMQLSRSGAADLAHLLEAVYTNTEHLYVNFWDRYETGRSSSRSRPIDLKTYIVAGVIIAVVILAAGWVFGFRLPSFPFQDDLSAASQPTTPNDAGSTGQSDPSTGTNPSGGNPPNPNTAAGAKANGGNPNHNAHQETGSGNGARTRKSTLLARIFVNSATLKPNTTTNASIVLNRPTAQDGVLVHLTSDQPGVLAVDDPVPVHTHEKNANFNITTFEVAKKTDVTITATLGDEKKKLVIHVVPDEAPGAPQ